VTEPSELQSALPMKCLPENGYRLDVYQPLVVAILRSAEHIRNYVRSRFRNMSISLVLFMVEET